MKNTAFLIVVLASLIVRAAGGEHGGGEHHEAAIPLESIGWQAANLGALLVVIIFFTRKSIIAAFSSRQQNYLDQAEKTKVALKEAETALKDIKTKITDLESGEQKSLETATREAALISENLVKEAQAATVKLKKDAEQLINLELQKAKTEINNLILNQAVITASQKISGSAGTSAQESGFIKQLEQVK